MMSQIMEADLRESRFFQKILPSSSERDLMPLWIIAQLRGAFISELKPGEEEMLRLCCTQQLCSLEKLREAPSSLSSERNTTLAGISLRLLPGERGRCT